MSGQAEDAGDAGFEGEDGEMMDEEHEEPLPELPELLGLDLEELRTVRHPVLNEVLEGLRERAERPSEMLWGFNNSM
ncbi:FxSxx-COOH cyclophane-containing RiPP peptide [Streptomyces sp. NPDC007901]|uniref:FxSxx-COOH cyclophane-containing RiPP peptide n=1 Tax=Streptomyces sp. NPDC007901 TaxID=3364785 RepID=UPI0036E6A9D3